MRSSRKSLTLAAVVLIAAGCVYFRDVDVPKRIMVPNAELPAPHESDFLQASVRFQPQTVDMVRRLESEARIDRDIWSIEMWNAIRGAQSGPGQATFSAGQGAEFESGGSTRRSATRRERRSAADFIFSENLNNVTAQVQRDAWNGHIFYFFSMAVGDQAPGLSGTPYESSGIGGSGIHHIVHVVDEKGRGVTSFRTGAVEPVEGARDHPPNVPSRPLMFDVAITDDGPWVLYRDRDGVFARPLVFSGSTLPGGPSGQIRVYGDTGRPAQLAGGRGSFTFGEPILISRAETPNRDFQFVSRVDDTGDFHVIWTDWREADLLNRAVNRHNLWYCRFDPQAGNACRRPVRLTSFAGLGPINLMVTGEEVYVSWIDKRFARGFWTRRNDAKLFLVRSGDRGASFGDPVSIHPPHDAGEKAYAAITMPAPGEGVLVFWGTQFRNFHEDHDLKYGHLLPDMETLLLGRDIISRDQLHETLIEKLSAHHRGLGSE